MKILHVNTLDKGGAANACKRLHLVLRSQDVDSKVLLRGKENNWPKSYLFESKLKSLSLTEKLQNKALRLAKELKLYKSPVGLSEEQKFLSVRSSELELFSFPSSDFDITESTLYKEADIINLHWVANFLDFKSFFENNTKPVVWTLHDMNPFTGGEHYIEEFLGIDQNGKPSFRQVSKEEKIKSEFNLELKKKAISQFNDLNIVAPSRWLAEEAKKSELFNSYPVHHIPNGLDKDIYKPLDKFFPRQLLNIPENKKVILFVADSIDNHRKGFIYLKKAFEHISDRKDVILCAIGNTVTELKSGSGILNLGFIRDERLMSAAYNAADAFVIPSLIDNLPNTVIESLMCGTPVIGFPVGGIVEMIKDKENGLLAKDISVSGLAEAISYFLNNPDKFSKESIRAKAVENYNAKKQADRYIKLYKSILEK
ncbi:glycosyltransferase [Salegentibacter chungangensis]|uniref:Glycosyltransferase n=1 Tax=Salegentibacter chungangensis TaxID=1335724 RepID=A0ABW3NND5_9FLAO